MLHYKIIISIDEHMQVHVHTIKLGLKDRNKTLWTQFISAEYQTVHHCERHDTTSLWWRFKIVYAILNAVNWTQTQLEEL